MASLGVFILVSNAAFFLIEYAKKVMTKSTAEVYGLEGIELPRLFGETEDPGLCKRIKQLIYFNSCRG